MVGFKYSPYTLIENKTIDGKVIGSSELVPNVRYFITSVSHSIYYVTPRYVNIEKLYR